MLYGGTERVVSYLTEELVRQGHEVTLFASGDSRTQARLISPCSSSLRLNADCSDRLCYHMVLVDRVYEHAAEFDVIHFHVDYLHFPTSRWSRKPRVTTLHGRLDIPDLVPLYKHFRQEPVVSISDSQRSPLPWLSWQGTVHHGLPDDLLPFQPDEPPAQRGSQPCEPDWNLDDRVVVGAKLDRHVGNRRLRRPINLNQKSRRTWRQVSCGLILNDREPSR